jgi:hypothetical protein
VDDCRPPRLVLLPIRIDPNKLVTGGLFVRALSTERVLSNPRAHMALRVDH